MKTYIWSVHDKKGTMQAHGEVTVRSDIPLTQVVKKVEEDHNINIGHYREFRLKEQ